MEVEWWCLLYSKPSDHVSHFVTNACFSFIFLLTYGAFLLSFAFSDWGCEGTLHLKLALTWVLADVVTTLLLCWRWTIMDSAIAILDFLCIISNNAKPSIIYMSIFCSKLHEVSPLSFCVHYLCVRLCRALFFSSFTRSFSLRSFWKYASEKSYLACP